MGLSYWQIRPGVVDLLSILAFQAQTDPVGVILTPGVKFFEVGLPVPLLWPFSF